MRVACSAEAKSVGRCYGVICLLALALGCGAKVDPNAPETAVVQGTIQFRGAPLPEGIVRFHPDESAGNPASGMIQPDGSFELSTYNRHDGAVVGAHKVTVEIALRLDGSTPDPPIQLPKPYGDKEQTPLEVTVESGKTNRIQLEIVE